MNKLAKGAIATGIATALFLGGSATLALWNDSSNIGASSEINTGVLTLDATESTWSTNPELWVPGDSFNYTTEVSITATGDNLTSHLSIDPASITGSTALLDALETTMDITNINGGTLNPVNGQTNTFEVAPENKNSGTPITATVTITVDFPANSVTELVAQGEEAHLADLQLLLTQIAS